MADAVMALLRSLAPDDAPRLEPLSGGVSSDIWRVDLSTGRVCVKRALPRLRVAQLWEAPIERNRYERLWLQAAAEAAPGSAPTVLAWDDEGGVFAMEYLGHPVWKSVLREGRADPGFAAQVGERLAAIHGATAGREDVRQTFQTDEIFHAIRLEPYLLATAARHPDLAPRLASLAEQTARTKSCLVHGDVSPKNILVAPGGPVFLDAECAWYGDPAFDVAFCVNHLLLKCVWVPAATGALLDCVDALAGAYLAGASWERPSDLEERVATLLPALLLARVDGKSPVEYLDETQRAQVRGIARALLSRGLGTVDAVKSEWRRSLT